MLKIFTKSRNNIYLLTIIAPVFFTNCTPPPLAISHGPMLGAIQDDSARIWFRTSIPGQATISLNEQGNDSVTTKIITTQSENDSTGVALFENLNADSTYKYTLSSGISHLQGEFKTFGPSFNTKPVRITIASCFDQRRDDVNGSIFNSMANRNADLNIFLGDMPYSKKGELDDLRDGHKKIRTLKGFQKLAASSPNWAIWDDHDFGPNNSDSTHPYKQDAYQAFKEYWANNNRKGNSDEGIYTSFKAGYIDFFLTDGRYHSLQNKKNPTMLGNKQFNWLCDGLKASKAKYKVIASGVQLTSENPDGWSGKYFNQEKSRLMNCISDHNIKGVLVVSGDGHRTEIVKHPLPIKATPPDLSYIYEVTSSPLLNTNISTPKKMIGERLYSHDTMQSLFVELEFFPNKNDNKVLFREYSGSGSLIHKKTLYLDQ